MVCTHGLGDVAIARCPTGARVAVQHGFLGGVSVLEQAPDEASIKDVGVEVEPDQVAVYGDPGRIRPQTPPLNSSNAASALAAYISEGPPPM